MSGSLKGIKHQDVIDNVVTRCMSKVTLAINAGSAATFKTTGTTTFCIAGLMYTKGALSANAMTAGYVQPASTTVYYAVTLDAAGTVRTRQGDYAGRIIDAATATGGIGNAAGNMGVRGDGGFPNVPGTECVIGYIKIVTDGSTTFTPATTALDAAGLTVTFVDVTSAPSI